MADETAVDAAIRVLNRALESDREAMEALVSSRVPCNATLADDETIQVGARPGDTFTLGPLGLINGLFGIQESGMGYICASYNLRCPSHGELPSYLDETEAEGLTVRDKCPRCGEQLGLGHLVKFMPTEAH